MQRPRISCMSPSFTWPNPPPPIDARQRGCAWAQVGREIGITKQAAHQRHGHPRRGSTRGATLLNTAFDKLELATPRVRMVLAKAEEAAHRRHHNWLGTEHLLEG